MKLTPVEFTEILIDCFDRYRIKIYDHPEYASTSGNYIIRCTVRSVQGISRRSSATYIRAIQSYIGDKVDAPVSCTTVNWRQGKVSTIDVPQQKKIKTVEDDVLSTFNVCDVLITVGKGQQSGTPISSRNTKKAPTMNGIPLKPWSGVKFDKISDQKLKGSSPQFPSANI